MINTNGNWENSKLCEKTTPFGRRVSTQFLVFPIPTRVDITVYQHGKCFIFVKSYIFSLGLTSMFCLQATSLGLCWITSNGIQDTTSVLGFTGLTLVTPKGNVLRNNQQRCTQRLSLTMVFHQTSRLQAKLDALRWQLF